MPISLNERNQPDRFEFPHWMAYQLPDGRAHITLSGVAIINYRGGADDFTRESFELSVRLDRAIGLLGLPPAPQGFYNALRLDQWIVFVTPNAFSNNDSQAGYAVDRFYLTRGSITGTLIDTITIGADVAARNRNGWLYRVAYHLMLIARITQERVPG